MFEKEFKAFTFDRIEDGWAVLYENNNDENKMDMPVEALPEDIKEGDIVHVSADGEIFVDKDKTALIKADLEARFRRLLKK